MILIKNKQAAPASSLAEKTNAFKFKKPDAKQSSGRVEATPLPTSPPVAAKGLLIGNPKPKTRIVPTPSPTASSIPVMSDDKYEVVADSVPEFTESSGNAFQEQLGMLQQAIDGTGDLKHQMSNILLFLDDNPQFKNNISPQDISVFVAGCRKVAGITVTEKAVRKTKAKKVDVKLESVMSDLADLELELF
jgi:hypothetical protein